MGSPVLADRCPPDISPSPPVTSIPLQNCGRWSRFFRVYRAIIAIGIECCLHRRQIAGREVRSCAACCPMADGCGKLALWECPSENELGGKRKQRYDCSIFRWVCMRINPLCMLARAGCDAQLSLPGLPALKWRSFRFRLHRAGVGYDDHRHAEDVLGSSEQWQARDSQLLLRLRLSSVHVRRDCSRSYVHPFPYAG
jgi:hypothetical protein